MTVRGDGLDDRQGLFALSADRCLVRVPGFFAGSLHLGAQLALQLVERRHIRDLLANDPLAHAPDRIELDLEAETLLRLVALVRAARRMPLRLGHLGHMDDRWDVLAAGAIGRELVNVTARDVIVAFHGVEVDARPAVLPAEPFEHRRDRALRCLELVRHRNPVAVVPDRDDQRDLQDARGVQALPEDPLARAGVPDRGEADLLAAAREAASDRTCGRRFAVQPRRPGQPDRARHLRADRGKLGRGLPGGEQILPPPSFVERARREVAEHLAPCRVRVAHDVRVGVELREVLREIRQADGEHEGLVPVVARPPIARPERARHAELGDLFALPGDAKGRVPHQDLAPRELAGRPAADREPIVRKDVLSAKAELRFRSGYRDIGASARLHPPSMLPVPGH